MISHFHQCGGMLGGIDPEFGGIDGRERLERFLCQRQAAPIAPFQFRSSPSYSILIHL